MAADAWIDAVERWTYVTGTPRVGVDGHHERIAPPTRQSRRTEHTEETIKIPNQIPNRSGRDTFPVPDVVSVDALTLVRFGLRSADDRWEGDNFFVAVTGTAA